MMVSMSPQPRKSPQQEVLGSLPRTRPQRRSQRRAPAVAEAAEAVEAVVTRGDPEKAKPPKAKSKTKDKKKTKDKAKVKAATKAPKAAPTAAPGPLGASTTPPAGYAIADEPAKGPPSGPELVTTAVQAAGELAQIGLSFGGSAVRSALRKLPRP